MKTPFPSLRPGSGGGKGPGRTPQLCRPQGDLPAGSSGVSLASNMTGAVRTSQGGSAADPSPRGAGPGLRPVCPTPSTQGYPSPRVLGVLGSAEELASPQPEPVGPLGSYSGLKNVGVGLLTSLPDPLSVSPGAQQAAGGREGKQRASDVSPPLRHPPAPQPSLPGPQPGDLIPFVARMWAGFIYLVYICILI